MEDSTESDYDKKNRINIKRNSLMELKMKQGRGVNVREEHIYFRVLSLFDKHYNKGFVIKDDRKGWSKDFQRVNLESWFECSSVILLQLLNI